MNNENLNTLLEMYNNNKISRELALNTAFSMTKDQDSLTAFVKAINNVEEKELTWEEKNEALKEENRKQAEETRKRQEERDNLRLEEEAKRRREEELQKINEEKEKDLNDKIEFLSNLKDAKGISKYGDIAEIKDRIDKEYADKINEINEKDEEDKAKEIKNNYNAELYSFEEFVNATYANEQAKKEQEENVKASQERYNSMSNEERQKEAINKYGIDSEQGQKARETNDRIKTEIQKDNYDKLVKGDNAVETDYYVVNGENENNDLGLDLNTIEADSPTIVVDGISDASTKEEKEKDTHAFDIKAFLNKEKVEDLNDAEKEFIRNSKGKKEGEPFTITQEVLEEIQNNSREIAKSVGNIQGKQNNNLLDPEGHKKVTMITTLAEKMHQVVDLATKNKAIAALAAIGVVAAAVVAPVVAPIAAVGLSTAGLLEGVHEFNKGRKL